MIARLQHFLAAFHGRRPSLQQTLAALVDGIERWGKKLVLLIALLCMGSSPGLKAYMRGDYRTAIAELKPLAEQGDPEAQYVLGATYANAQPPLRNLEEAERWTRMAAEQGHVNAMVDMAKLILFYQSKGISDAANVQAAPWCQRAAERGHPEAQFMIGMMHFSGAGAAQDNVRAYMWWILAASQRHALAQQLLERSRDKITADEIRQAEQLAKQWTPIK